MMAKFFWGFMTVAAIYMWWAVKLTSKGRVVKRSYRFWFALTVLLTASGCCHHHVTVSGKQDCHAWYYASDWSLVNSTRYNLEVFLDGKPVATKVCPGQVVLLQKPSWENYGSVAVSAFTPAAEYVGSASHIFTSTAQMFGQFLTWSVLRIDYESNMRTVRENILEKDQRSRGVCVADAHWTCAQPDHQA